ncbi:MAG: DegT/DnrJ/EryC1/StrS family aminotransferase [Anaerostipes sp.]|nr:DegT/DnrJ/EryC1/StrS family aminotransferase [Anaerostipes sp.]
MKTKDLDTRQAYIQFMKESGVGCVFHYVPLHSAPAGLRFGRFAGVDQNTTCDSDRLVRLPMYYNIADEDLKKVIEKTIEFFNR